MVNANSHFFTLTALAMCGSLSFGAESLTIGALISSSTDKAISISVLPPMAGGSGSGYVYNIYRGSTPNFVPDAKNLLASVPKLNESFYVDSKGLRSGVEYYYKVTGHDSAGATVNAQPGGLGSVNASVPLAIANRLKDQTLNIIYMGDSITWGAGLPSPDTQSPPVLCSQYLRNIAGTRDVYFSNQGHGGHTTGDFLPGRGDFSEAEKAAQNLIHDHDGLTIFMIMLGTNDSANGSMTGSPLSPAGYHDNLKAITEKLLADFQDSKVLINVAPWYSPNTHNGANYEEGGLARLASYLPAYEATLSEFAKTAPGRVFAGDRHAFEYFSQSYQTDFAAENGNNGTFYLHPNAKGAAQLGTFWGSALAMHLVSNWK